MIGLRPVDQAEPVVEAMVGRGGSLALTGGHAEVPLPEVSSAVAVFPEQLRDGRFALEEMHFVSRFVDDGVDSGAIMVAACQESGTRGRAGGSSRVEIGEAHAL